jgi:hypothetical protein
MHDIESLSWLAGLWTGVREDSTDEEFWLQPKGGTMHGLSRTIQNGQTSFEEYLKVGPNEGVMALMLIHKIGSPAQVFQAIEMDGNQALFGNADDPDQVRIHYQRKEKGVYARVSGLRKGEPFLLEFNFSKVPSF